MNRRLFHPLAFMPYYMDRSTPTARTTKLAPCACTTDGSDVKKSNSPVDPVRTGQCPVRTFYFTGAVCYPNFFWRLLIFISLSLYLASCSMQVLPRDEAEIYEQGLEFWKNRNYEMAIRTLTPFIAKDSLYMPLYTILADSYYRLNQDDKALLLLERAERISGSEIIENLRITFKALENRVESQQERVNFPQYIEDVSRRYAIDKSLLLAMIRAGSSYSLQGKSIEEPGIMGLSKEFADKIGLMTSEYDMIEGLAIFEPDERFDPAKSIYNAVRYLHSLLEENRVGERNADLIAALTAYYSTGKDSTESVEHLVNQVIDYYRFYRHNIPNKEQAFSLYSEINPAEDNPFTSSISYIPDVGLNTELNAYKDLRLYLHLYLPNPLHQAYYYNNLALLCKMLGDMQQAEELYVKALNIIPEDNTVLFNYATLLFDTGEFGEAYKKLTAISENAKEYKQGLLLQGYSLLLQDELNSLAVLLESLQPLSDPHFINLKGLCYFKTGELFDAADEFSKAYELSNEPVFAANYLAAFYQLIYAGTAYAELTGLNKITRQYDTGYIWPVDLRHISSGWGWRPSPFSRVWRNRLENFNFHNGIDIPGITGTPVRASADGEVIISQTFRLGGESVFIQHPDNYITTYLHLDERFVEEGEMVKQGQTIGLLGNTGQSTGAHLHFGMFNNKNQPANPLNYLPVY